jgi:hypothetical protein
LQVLKLIIPFPNPDKPEPKLKDKTEKGMKKISSGTQELTKVRNKILLISRVPDFLIFLSIFAKNSV